MFDVRQAVENQGGVNKRRFDVRTAVELEKVDNNFLTDLNNRINNYFKDADSDFKNVSYSNYRDIADKYSDNEQLAQDIELYRKYVVHNSEKYDAEDYNSIISGISNYQKNIDLINTQLKSNNSYFAQWDTEEDYLRDKKIYETNQMTAAEIEPYLRNSEIEAQRSALVARQQEIKNQIKELGAVGNKGVGAQKKTELNQELSAINMQIKELDEKTSQNAVAYTTADGEKITWQTLYSIKKREEETQKLANDAVTAADFEEQSKYVSTKLENRGSRLTSDYGLGYDDLTYEYINDVDGMRDKIQNAYWNYASDSINGTGSSYENKGLDYMTKDEVKIYNYYYATEGKEKADRYLDLITDSLIGRKSSYDYKNKIKGTFGEYTYWIPAGIDQYSSNVRNLFNTTDDYIPASSTQRVSSMVRENIGEKHGKLGTTLYDLGTTTTNMLPSILASTAANIIVPGSGQFVGAGLMGMSAAGGAYQEMLNLGYDKSQARTYSALVGGSEALLSTLFSGISKLGGKVTNNAISKLISGIDNGLARFAIEYGGKIGSEALEEGLQEVLTPFFENIAIGIDINDWDSINWEEAAYSALLGALSAGIFETVPGAISTVSKNIRAKSLYSGSAQDIVAAGLEMPEGSAAYNLATKYQAKLDSGKQLSGSELNRIVEVTDTAKINHAVQLRLTELGETSNVSAVADVITKQVMGENTTTEQNNTLKNSQYGARVLNELSPENIQSDNYSSEWVKNIGTYGTNASLYNQANGSAVDNDTVSSYNGTRGDINGSTNTGLLAGGKVSAVGGGNNSLREQSANTGIIRGQLGALSGNQGTADRRLAAGTSSWISETDRQPAQKVGGGLDENFLGDLHRVKLSDTDTIGRILSPELQEELKDTVFKTEDGTIISFFHWTPNQFEVFKYGDGAFHFGTLPAAVAIKEKSKGDQQGYFKEVYINSKNPLVVYDNGSFSPSVISGQLVEYGLMSFEARKEMSALEGFYSDDYNTKACKYLLEYIKELGFDSYLYQNKNENTGAWSVGVFDADQIITVAENGVLKENSGVSEADFNGSAFSMDENSDLQSSADGTTKEKIETMSFDEDSAEDSTEPLSYEEKILLESSGIDSSITQKQRSLNRIAEKLKVKIAWDIDGDPAIVGNGYYENGVIHMNKRAKAYATVFAHEYVHHIEQSKLWPAFKKFVEGTGAYKNWITEKGHHNDIEQATNNYKARLETAYKNAGKEIADTDIIANFIAEGLFGGDLSGNEKANSNAQMLLSEFAQNDKWYHNLIRFAREMINRFKGDRVQADFYKMERLLLKARKDVQKNPTTDTGGRKYSLGYTNDNKPVAVIEEDILSGVSKSKWVETVKKTITEKFSGGIPIAGRLIKVNRITKSEYTNSKYSKYLKAADGTMYADKFKTANNLDDILLASTNYVNEDLNHTRQDNFKEFARGDVFIRVGNNDYAAKVIVGFTSGGSMVLYDVVDFLPITLKLKTDTQAAMQNAGSHRKGVSVNSIISQNASTVNTQYMQNGANNSANTQKNSVTPASEADTIKRLAAEGRADEYKTDRIISPLDAEKVANRWLKANKSSFDKAELTENIKRMIELSNGSAWGNVIKLAQQTAKSLSENSEHKRDAASLDDLTMSIFSEIVNNRERVRLDDLAQLEAENTQYRRQLTKLQKDVNRKNEELQKSRQTVRQEVIKERTEYADRVKNRERIRRAVRNLDSKLRTNSNVKHVPEGLQGAIRDFCGLFLVNDRATFSRKDLADLYVAYSSLGDGDGTVEVAGGYSEYIEDMIKNTATILDGKSLPQLSDSELIMLRDIAENLVHIVNNENEVFLNGRKTTLEKIGNAALGELQDRESKQDLKLPGGDKVNSTKDEAMRFFGTGNLKPIYFFEQLGGTFKKLFDDMIRGQYECVRHLETAQTFVQNTLKDSNYWKWIDEKPLELKLEQGGRITLTKGQAMALYATWKREQTNETQKAQHLYQGGIVLNDKQVSKKIGKNGKEGLLNWQQWVTKAHKLTPTDIQLVIQSLSNEQINFVDTMISYLSDDMAALGNRVTMELYGIKRFKEDYYFPYKTAENFRPNEANGKRKETKLKNSSFTKQTVEKANTPIVVEDFLEVWAKHVSEMCQYSTMTLPIENMSRVFGFRKSPDDNFNAQAVRAEVQRVAGKEGVQYVQQLIDDLNGGLVSLPGDKWYQIAVSKFKKNAVFASASVVVQQPSAICRAFSVINPKYFVKTTFKIAEKNYAELKKYCPVAILKEAGRFDVGTGSQLADWLTRRSYEGAKEKSKALFTDSEFRDDMLSAAAAKADEMTWAHIWAAAKAQIKATTNIKVGSEEFYKAAAKLFNEAIEKTQVYDSVLTRSENMRSKSSFTQMTTAFMAEPTTTLNMLWKAADEVKNHNVKAAGRIVTSIVTSILFNAILKSFVTAARDDDEDESYAEKYLQEVVANFTGDIGIWNMIPVIKDVASIFEGYTVDRTDVSLVEDLVKGFKALSSENYTDWEKFKSVIGPIAAFFGLPVKNVIRDAEAAWNVVSLFIEGKIFASGTEAKYAMLESLPWGDDSAGHYYELLYDAQRSGDEEQYQEVYNYLIEKGKDESDIRNGIRKYYRESTEIQKELESYEEKIVRMTYYDKLEEDKKEKVLSRIRTYLVDKAINADTGEKMSASSQKAAAAEKKGTSAAVYLLASAGFEDTDNSGGISKKEKIAAINKMDISQTEKILLISLYTDKSK